MSTPQVPPSPLKIVPKEYMDTPSSSATASPAESCASDTTKQLKPWERAASIGSSVDSLEASEPLWEDDVEPEGPIMVENSSKVAARSLRMQTLVWSMQQRLHGLQRLVEQAVPQETQRSRGQTLEDAEEGTRCSSQFLVAKAVLDGDESGSLRRCAQDLALVDEATENTDEQEVKSARASEDKTTPAMSTLLNRVKTLEAQLKNATEENQQLLNTVHRLEEDNARLQAQTTFNPLEGPSTYSNDDSGSTETRHDPELKADGGISRLTSAIFGNPSAFEMIMEEDMTVLKNHERCQHKLHELWGIIRTLKTFVETYELERNSMRIQRNEAIAEAERADAENVKLACSGNPQRKIKYLEQVKKDNQALRRKNRALNVRIAKQAAKLIREKNGCSVFEEEEDAEASHDATLDDTLLQEDDDPSCGRTSEEILRSMLDHRGVLKERLERLRMARQDLPDVDGDDSSDESELPTTATYLISELQGSTNLLLGVQS
ncbi:hypothetical protein PRNP1_002511 [Phytophthora ramorum]